MSRKDSRGMFANVLGQINQEPAAPTAQKINSPHLLKVAAGVRQIQEKGEFLEKILKEGERVLDIDPDQVAPSPIPDRFDGAYDSAAIEDMAESIRERGQIVPGLVRPTQNSEKPYQIVFGRRRLAAVKKLGLPFRAVVRELSDEQAIIFQGEENTNRNDLSFIEKCAFALSQEQAGYKRDVISASLSTGKSHISEMLSIASSLPRDILLSIGPATEIGRRRWIDFAQAWSNKQDAHICVEKALEKLSGQASSEERFAAALAALKAVEKVSLPDTSREIRANGFLLATVNYSKSGAKMNFSKSVPRDFVEFLNHRMEALHREFLQSETQNRKG